MPDKGLITRYQSVADISLIYQADTVVVWSRQRASFLPDFSSHSMTVRKSYTRWLEKYQVVYSIIRLDFPSVTY